MSVYIEYISRRPGVPLHAFHAIAGAGQKAWASQYTEDRLILNIGRTWRLGPEPEYLAVWHTPGKSLERLDEWESIFASGEADPIEHPFDAVARIDVAGFYKPLIEPVPGSEGPVYYGEFFDWADGATGEDIRAFFGKRNGTHGQLTLNLLADRIGLLGPEPRGVAFWQAPSYAAVESVARDAGEVDAPIRVLRAGVYADLGREVL
jgi:hypothetical protein